MRRIVGWCFLFIFIMVGARFAGGPPMGHTRDRARGDTATHTSAGQPSEIALSNRMPHDVRAQRQLIGGLSSSRSGSGSFTDGEFFSQARMALMREFPEVSFTSTPELTAEFLAQVDVLILTSLSTQLVGFPPLSEVEQEALRHFVASGGNLIALLDNSAFAATNESLAAPFGVQAVGKIEDVTATVTAPTSHPITNGPFGLVSSFTQVAPGAITLPTSAVCLATNPLGCALAVFDPRALSPTAGAAVFYSDANTFVDDRGVRGGDFLKNEALFLNTVAFVISQAGAQPPRIHAIRPAAGQQGETVEAVILGENLAGATSVQFSGTGLNATIASGGTATSLPVRISISADAQPGTRAFTVSTPGGSTNSEAITFTVLPRQDFVITAAPTVGTVVQGDATTFVIHAQGTSAFTGLVTLTTGPLPQGFTAQIDRPMVAPGGSVSLTIMAARSIASGTINFTVTGIASISGRTVTHEISLGLNVIPSTVTTVSGLVLTADHLPIPLPGVRVGLITDKQTGRVDPTIATTTDAAGNFVLYNVPAGEQTFLVDGSTATVQGKRYPPVEETFRVVASQPNRLNFIVHLPAIDEQHIMVVQNNAPMEQRLSTPTIPNLEIMIPAGTVIRAPDGSIVTQLSLTPVATDRAPGPLPEGVIVPMLFSIQPGRAEPSQPVPVFFPNFTRAAPGTKADLYTFDVTLGRFVKYGTGTVSPNGQQVVPDIDPATGQPYGLRRFAWHFPAPPPPTPAPPPDGEDCPQNDPVDPSTGIFEIRTNDIVIGGNPPLTLTRMYRTMEPRIGLFGIGTSHNFDYSIGGTDSRDVVILVIPQNRQFQLRRQPDGTFINTTDPLLRGARMTGSFSEGFVLRFRDGMILRFDPSGRLIEQSDRNDRKLTLTRDSGGRIRAIVDPEGRQLTFGYDARGLVMAITDPIGRTVQYAYDSEITLIAFTDAAGGVTRSTYDSRRRVKTIINPLGVTVVENEYDSADRVIKQTNADGGVYHYEYTTSGGLITQAKITDPMGAENTFRFNCDKYIIGMTDALGRTTIHNRMIGMNFLQSTIDPLGRASKLTFDENGNLTSYTTEAATSLQFTYDPVLNLETQVVSEEDRVTRYSYDRRGNLIQVVNPRGSVIQYAYDASGNNISATDNLGNITRFEYDPSGNLTAFIDANGRQTSYEYDQVSRLIAETDPAGLTTRYIYDPLDRLIEIISPKGAVTRYAYDALGNIISVTDATNRTVTFAYDAAGRVIRRTDPSGRSEIIEYNRNGLRTRYVDRRGLETRFEYDPLGRLIRQTHADGSTVTYTYDALHQLVRIEDSISGPIERRYDDFGNIISETTPQGIITYTYDRAERRTRMKVSGQADPVFYEYDRSSRVTRIVQGGAGVAIEYDGEGRRSRLTLPHGVSADFAYDAEAQLRSIGYTRRDIALFGFSYEYDEAGNLIKQTGAHLQSLAVDTVQATYDDAHRLLTYNDQRLAYDENGNLLSMMGASRTRTFTYDARNRLITINGERFSATFAYDALGRRISKTVNGVTTTYLYDGVQVVQEQVEGRIRANLLRHPKTGDVFMRHSEIGEEVFIRDALGSTVALVAGSGDVVTRYNYDDYGAATMIGSPSTNAFLFTGREVDESGLYYLLGRYYDPTLRRFISEDPALTVLMNRSRFGDGAPGEALHPYAYASNNPLQFTDPTGLYPTVQPCDFTDKQVVRIENAKFNINKRLKEKPCCLTEKDLKCVLALKEKFDYVCDKSAIKNGACAWVADIGCSDNKVYLDPKMVSGWFKREGIYGCGSLENTLLHELLHCCGRPDGQTKRDHNTAPGSAGGQANRCF
ncbi:MAG: hypothetical protein HY314_16395 [Acidobacteria bacterium]|nr:hypothetical protein [Acidobacteriota bacterium]